MSETETTNEPQVSADAPAQEGPDLTEQFADLNNKLTSYIESQQVEQPAAEPLDILDAPDDSGDEYDYDDATADGWEQPTDDPRLDQVWEWATQREQERIRTGLQSLGTKYNDFTEKVPEIRSTLDSMGITDPALRGNAALVERIYLSLKAEADANAETPAEEAAGRGATIERGASASAPEEVDPMDEFTRTFGEGRTKSAFG